MDYTRLLQHTHSLLKKKKGQSRRQIIRFTNPSEFQRFQHTLQRMQPSYQTLEQIHPLGLIHSFLFPLHPSIPIDQLPVKIKAESDRKAMVHDLPRSDKNRPSKRNIPWGIQHIKAPAAWKTAKGEGVKIAVIDTGINYYHPDLKQAVQKGFNVLHRYQLPVDDNGHGTHIAGTIAASSASDGMTGVAPHAHIYPVKAFDYHGSAYISDIIMGLEWCISQKMDIINMSFGMKEHSESLQYAIRKAADAGCIIVASSGNDGNKNDIDYPAKFPETISVSATNKDRRIAKFSNRSKAVNIYAPGDKIQSTWLREGYFQLSGTSMATAHVSGVIALLLSIKPSLTMRQVRVRLKRTSLPLNMKTKKPLSGEIQALRAVRYGRKRKQKRK
ncbi:S8 family peptidase [Marinicrinis sediminis]|uniref:S8 family peptidase n=1 Tax=Marinicrinis sediminis TaxID=1652465 RepID=A0ABW5RFV1_9BACL